MFFAPGTILESQSASGRFALQLDGDRALILPNFDDWDSREEPYISHVAIPRETRGWIVRYDPEEGMNA